MFAVALRRWFYQLALAPPLVRCYNRIQPLKSLGKRGEREAERFYLRRGLTLIHRSYANRLGEIDLILVDGTTIVFAEVKTRSSRSHGDPTEAVDDRKQLRITRTAAAFLKSHQLTEFPVRFDVVSIIWPAGDTPAELRHYPSAFEAAGEGQLY